ncbi:MAG: tetratricopeptide repeat protein [Phycisphaerae bacterium]|nr:tetratricopeptide repeat protein [Phycisphaerae bacterium]
MPTKVSVLQPSPLLPPHRSKLLLLGAVLVVLTLLVYIPAMGGGFLWDDDWLLTENPNLSSFAGLGRLWKVDWWGDKLVPDYFPVTWTSFWIEWRLWHNHAAGYHVTNILLHATSALLLWRVLARLGVRWAWLAGVLFAVHPVNVTSVAWIAERKNTLSMVFYLLALGCYLRFDDRAGRRWYVAALGMFLLALLSKTSVVMLPVVLLLVAWWRRDRVTWRDLLKAAPFFVLAVVLSILGILYQRHVVIQDSPIRSAHEGFFFRLAVAGMAPWFYLLKAVVPHPLAMVYPRWDFDPRALVNYLPGLALIGVLALLWRLRPWCKGALVALAYFVVTLFPVMGFFSMYYHLYSFVADHWQYVPMIGLLALVSGVAAFLTRYVPRVAVQAAAVVVVGALSVGAWHRSKICADSFKLWKDNIATYPNHFLPYYNLGRAQDEENRFDDALRNYEKSIQLNKGFDRPYTNIGSILARRGDIFQAARYFDEALRIYPDSIPARANLGYMLYMMGRTDEALHQLRLAEKVSKDSVLVQVDMALVLMGVGRIDEAMEHARIGVAADPSDYEPRILLAKCLSLKGLARDVIEQATVAAAIKPDSVEAHTLLGLHLRSVGRSAEAAEHWRKVLESQPDDVDALNNLAITMVDCGNLPDALTYLTKALNLQPGNLEIQINLAFVLARTQRPAEAVELYRRALAARPNWPDVLTSLAALLANYPDPAIRKPAEAVTLAQRACELTNYARPDMMDVLASAYATAGRRSDAIQMATRAMELARSAGNAAYAAALAQRIRAWSGGQSVSQPAGGESPIPGK